MMKPSEENILLTLFFCKEGFFIDSYYTVPNTEMTEIVVQKSRFLCYVKPVKTGDEALAFIQHIQKKHHDASHNCFAYIIDPTCQRSSDDGEPTGTAGRPILEILHANQLIHTIIVITRYFGGIKLGTGGLIRAYGQGAKAVISKSEVVQKVCCKKITIQFDYTYLGKLEHQLRQMTIIFEKPQFTDQVCWSFWVPIPNIEFISQQVTNWTNGKIQISEGDIAYQVIDVQNP